MRFASQNYCYKYCDTEVKKAKGVSLAVSEKTMKRKDYKDAMTSNEVQRRPIYGIRSFNQQLYTTLTVKVVLNAFCDKMVMVDDRTNVPFGFKDL